MYVRDNVQWGPEQIKQAEEKLKVNSSTFLNLEEAAKYESESARFWDSFYSTHENKFFKDRHWLFTEVPELAGKDTEQYPAEPEFATAEYPGKSSGFRILEVLWHYFLAVSSSYKFNRQNIPRLAVESETQCSQSWKQIRR